MRTGQETMTANRPTNLSPSACFVVERVPGTGYTVTASEGPRAGEWKGRALDLLDAIGQPDPKGPAEYVRLLGPIAPSGECVSVSVKLKSNGEAWYHQAWFQVSTKARPRSWNVSLAALALVVGFIAGMLAFRAFVTPDRPTIPVAVSNEVKPPQPIGDSSPREPVWQNRVRKMHDDLGPSRELRAKLTAYLAQEGFAVDSSAPVVDKKRSVKLIADLDTTPPPRETIRLSNVEVAKLLQLLETLDNWTVNAKMEPMEPSAEDDTAGRSK